MPTTMGTAILCVTSDLVRWLHMMGSNPAMMAMTVIIFGRTRSTAPSMMAAFVSSSVIERPSRATTVRRSSSA